MEQMGRGFVTVLKEMHLCVALHHRKVLAI